MFLCAHRQKTDRYRRVNRSNGCRPTFQPLEPRKLLSATTVQIGEALDLDPAVVVTYEGHADAVETYYNDNVHGLRGLPSGVDHDFLIISTGLAFDAVRTTDVDTRETTTQYRDLGDPGVDDDYAIVRFTLDVPDAVYSQRLLIDFVYASDEDTDGGDFFDIEINGVNIAESEGDRIEAGGMYVTNERDSELDDDVADFGFAVGTEYTDLLTAAYTVPDGVETIEVVLTIRDSEDAEQDAWALIDNVRFTGTQVVYLDFDGENIGDFLLPGVGYDVPDFDANDFGLGGDYADVIQADLEAIFADFDIVFTTDVPAEGDYMHVVVGGENTDRLSIADTEANEWLIREIDDDPRFREFFNLTNFRNPDGEEDSYGLADRLDLGNQNQHDMAVVFAEQISSDGYTYDHLRDTIAHYIGRNLGLRGESNAFIDSIMAENIEFRGDTFEDDANTYVGDEWGDLEALGQTQNAHEVLLDVLGSVDGDATLRNSWGDARGLNEAHWTISRPVKRDLYDAQFIIIGDQHTRPTITTVDTWIESQILVTDYAGQDPQIVITAASRAGGTHNYETVGPANLGQFSEVNFDAPSTSITLWEFFNDQKIGYQGTSFLFQTQAADTEVYYSSYTHTEDDGDEVTFKLSSGSGLFSILETDDGPIVTLAETDGGRDSLKITVKKKEDGDKRALVGGILGSGLKTLTADKADFVNGPGVDLTELKTGKFGSFDGGSSFNVRQEEKTSGDYRFDVIGPGTLIASGHQTKKLMADDITATTMIFDQVDKIDSKANLEVDRFSARDAHKAMIKVKDDLVGGTWNFWNDVEEENDSLKKLDVKGSVTGDFNLTATGRVRDVKVKDNFEGSIEALAFINFKVFEDATGSVLLTTDGSNHINYAVKIFQVKGVTTDFLFQANNDVKNFKFGAVFGSNFYVGFDFSVTSGLPVDAGLLTNEDARIRDLKISGDKDEAFDMGDSVFSAPDFKSIKLGLIDGRNDGIAFGVSAITIDKIEYDTGTGKVKNKKDDSFFDNDASDDFYIGRIV